MLTLHDDNMLTLYQANCKLGNHILIYLVIRPTNTSSPFWSFFTTGNPPCWVDRSTCAKFLTLSDICRTYNETRCDTHTNKRWWIWGGGGGRRVNLRGGPKSGRKFVIVILHTRNTYHSRRRHDIFSLIQFEVHAKGTKLSVYIFMTKKNSDILQSQKSLSATPTSFCPRE